MPLRISKPTWLTDEDLAKAKTAYATFCKRAAKLPKEWKAKCFRDLDGWYAEFYAELPDLIEGNVAYYEQAQEGMPDYLDYVDFDGRVRFFKESRMHGCQSGCMDSHNTVQYGHDYSNRTEKAFFYPKNALIFNFPTGSTHPVTSLLCAECVNLFNKAVAQTDVDKEYTETCLLIRSIEIEHTGRALPASWKEAWDKKESLSQKMGSVFEEWLKARKTDVADANKKAGAVPFATVSAKEAVGA